MYVRCKREKWQNMNRAIHGFGCPKHVERRKDILYIHLVQTDSISLCYEAF